MESILTSIKSLLGIQEDMTNFDKDIIPHINTVFFILEQLGVNPGVFFSIKDKEKIWDDYLIPNLNLELVKSYIYFKVRLMFDPPIGGPLIEVMKQQASELEWRIYISVDPKVVVIPPVISDEDGVVW